MASRQLFFLVPLIILLSLFISSSHSSSAEDPVVSSASASQKVDLSLYYETLCPYCANFVVNHLVKLFQTQIISIVNLRLVPWGNANLYSNGSIVCQHGKDECLLNTVDACAIDVWPDVNTHFRLIYCIERLADDGKLNEWKSCFQKSGLPLKPVEDCYNGGRGIQLDRQYGEETARLNPPHEYVPWVVVNNKPLLDDYERYLSYVCKAYKGSALPNACKSLQFNINSSEKADQIQQVCHPVGAKNLTSPPEA
ncbi:hypothetical protein L1049_008341 [Liquidambar formosana]|uniref:Gamma-interferon-inducible lysosomal thiol reductase n=1 Tax=Liquidambar formosana TaxID=63359 RepID=A0AAP0S3I3_LIQFO